MFIQNAIGGALLSRFLGNTRRPARYRTSAYGRRRAPQGGFLSSPIGRIGLGSLAFYAARRYLGRQRPV